jgi:hypothetical protein
MKPETHVDRCSDLEEMRSNLTNCHPHPIGIGREQRKTSNEAEVDLYQPP